MSNSNAIGITLIILAILGMYLQSKGTLQPIVSIITSPGDTAGSTVKLGELVIAVIALIFVLSFLDDSTGIALIGLLGLGAIMYNHTLKGNNDLLHTKLL